MRLYGLTGGIGTGKSTVAQMLRELGATVIDADLGARAVIAPGTEGLERLVEEFGPAILDAEGRLDRPRMAELIFSDADARARLNAIVHPRVGLWLYQRTAEAVERGAELVFHDVPLIYENGRQDDFEAVVVVFAPPEVAIERLVGRGLTEADARARVAVQLPIAEKVALADRVIDNSGNLEATRRQVELLWEDLRAEPGSA